MTRTSGPVWLLVQLLQSGSSAPARAAVPGGRSAAAGSGIGDCSLPSMPVPVIASCWFGWSPTPLTVAPFR